MKLSKNGIRKTINRLSNTTFKTLRLVDKLEDKMRLIELCSDYGI